MAISYGRQGRSTPRACPRRLAGSAQLIFMSKERILKKHDSDANENHIRFDRKLRAARQTNNFTKFQPFCLTLGHYLSREAISEHLSGKEHDRLTMIYRRYHNSMYWHFNPQCPYWPETDYDERTSVEIYNRFCPDCIRLASSK